ncbi:MAG: acyl-CoA mutase large subunit family protein [Bacteroidetes bacterium]|nr:acyl-CoA mutase large subunit family protein [Bacteroidota bacterium]
MDHSLPTKLNLRDDFSPSGYDAWRQVAEADLKGVPFEKKLVTPTYEGINLQPIYTIEDLKKLQETNNFPGFPNFLRGSAPDGCTLQPWLVAASLTHPYAEEYNSLLLDALSRGQNSVVLPLDITSRSGLDADYGKPGETGKGGVSISGIGSLSRAFNGVDLTACPLFVNAGFSPLAFMALLNGYLNKSNLEISKIAGAVYGDPVGFLFENGSIPVTINEAFDQIKKTILFLEKQKSGLRTIGINGSVFVDKGATAVQELGLAMSVAVESLVRLSESGLSPESLVNRMVFVFGTSTNLFMEIAKFRAARILFSEVLNQMNIPQDNVEMFTSARTSSFYHSTVDPYVNMLRITTQAFSAVIGGVQMIETLPFNSLFAAGDEFAERIARNTQIILSEESHLNHVIDAAGGSYYIETLTNEIASEAWKYFKEIESAGGIVESLHKGRIQNDIRQINEKRQKDVATRKSVIVGVNSYANVKENPVHNPVIDLEEVYKKRAEYLQKLRVSGNGENHSSILIELENINHAGDEADQISRAAALAERGATLGEIFSHLRKSSDNEKIETVTALRPAERFESLRVRAFKEKTEKGSLPKIYLFNIGSIKQYKVRADFARGFFEAGGCEVIYPAGVQTISEGIQQALSSCAGAFVLCSTDDTYPELVPSFVEEIKKADSSNLCILAGYPKDQVEAHRQSGIDEFIFLGADVVTIISSIFDKTGVVK